MKVYRLLIVLTIILASATGVFGYWLYRELNKPFAHSLSNQYVEIPHGSTPEDTVNKLELAGVIGRAWPLSLYIRFSGAGPRLKAGEYRFPTPISPLGVLRKLEDGQQRLARFTVIEGWTRWDIASAMANVPGLKLANADEALALMNNINDIRDLDAGAVNLEGYLYPDTYSFPPDTTPREMIAAMVKRFRQVWRDQADEQALPLNKTPREIVTVASLIETEAKLPEETPLIASVIYNRLKIGMPLGIDSTIIYASKLAGKWKNDGKVYKSDVERQSPYNTRIMHGLPPGPIASSGARSLAAALRPAQTDFLYYVREPSRDDGAHNFYNNEADFQKGVQALRAWERARDANPPPLPVVK